MAGITPILGAAAMGHLNAMKILLEHGADMNATSDRGETALCFGVRLGKTEIVEWLLSQGSSTRCKLEGSGRNLLHLATLNGYTDIAGLLVDNGVDINATDTSGKTALQYAEKYGHTKISTLLKKNGAAITLADRDNERPPFLTRKLKNGDAEILYLGNAGWAVKTTNRLLIFDYVENERRADEASSLNGHILPEEIKNCNVIVFVTHEHPDHFSPVTHKWKKSVRNIHYIFGFQPKETPDYVQVMNPREEKVIDGITISTISSTDAGVGFLVQADDLLIFHAGDHANRTKELEKSFSDEIDYLAERGLDPDIAFLPIKGCGFGDTEAVKAGLYYALDKLNPRAVFPMHASGEEYFYRSFADDAAGQNFKSKFVCAENKGDSFILHKR